MPLIITLLLERITILRTKNKSEVIISFTQNQ
ncbi:Uncharacterised protein [Mycoplasmopsis synoviae]|uniref:Uncharacterized protein n=1 Tax=Mycoplasmopsis synoviae TaxID=2109 RepID=A0A3B0P5R1_MYCSY|nr:Uncharacterised protein [Mycoplasmopsis synoviae]